MGIAKSELSLGEDCLKALWPTLLKYMKITLIQKK